MMLTVLRMFRLLSVTSAFSGKGSSPLDSSSSTRSSPRQRFWYCQLSQPKQGPAASARMTCTTPKAYQAGRASAGKAAVKYSETPAYTPSGSRPLPIDATVAYSIAARADSTTFSPSRN